MPILPPPSGSIVGLPNYTVGTAVSRLPAKFGNRVDVGDLSDGGKPATAVVQAVQELTETYEFEELKYQTSVPNLTPLILTVGNPLVPVVSILNDIQNNSILYPQFQGQPFSDITDVYTFWMWFSGGVNQAGRTLKYRRVTTIDSYSYGITSNNQGLGMAPPVYYTRFGNLLQVGPVPDKDYSFFVRVKLRHPFPFTAIATFTPAVLTATIVGGVVTAVTINSGGQGYMPLIGSLPLVFSVSPTGNTAQGTFGTNVSGVVNAVSISVPGSGYTSAPTVNTGAIQAQQIFIEDSWQEIVEYSACLRLALWEGASEYVQMFKIILNGDPKNPGEPGLIKSRVEQMKRDEMHNERQLSLRAAQYTFAR